jgi:RING-finger-containing ubiquitin ligase
LSNLEIDENDTTSAEEGIKDSDSLELPDEIESELNQIEKDFKKEDIIVDSFREWRSTRHGIDDSIQSSIYSPKSCSICMSRYKDGDEICWSRNEKCYHAFHLGCMMEWLMKHNDCPMCRRNYLRTDEPENVGNDRDARNDENV